MTRSFKFWELYLTERKTLAKSVNKKLWGAAKECECYARKSKNRYEQSTEFRAQSSFPVCSATISDRNLLYASEKGPFVLSRHF